MKLGDGVEQAIHSVTLLAALPAEGVLSAAALAEFYGVSTSYLLKHLQALSGAGIVHAVSGPSGGYRLAKTPEKITLLDIVLAVEGPEPAFRCKEIRRNGPKPLAKRYFKAPCQVNAAMLRAEQAYRQALRAVTVAQLIAEVKSDDDGSIARRSCAFFDQNMRQPGSKP
ncbi:RrF2 family transcriptional regulator [Denitrobaculum tricleocarpae]|uniref:Rrf2 family transcriptional regulator n=1 Tax=Denitrobaculum tricleocarpae TaxID=2591009 RepID=A0A545U2F5_9PROT|nr:Rrf2 family transcriptional regulator [Denitrobaculum tricleocarpae]TQV83614.1 Rrf2 family transcriptional regulator [Denitrobaculum tricleocarpae]